MIKPIIKHIFSLMGPLYKNFPHNYLVIDVETTGTDTANDLITQFGYCLVVDGKQRENQGIYLDWTNKPYIDQGWLKNRLLVTKEQVENKDGKPTGKTYHTSYDKLHEIGIDPIISLQSFLGVLTDARANRLFFVAHNGYRFDARIINRHFQRFLNSSFSFNENEIFDTGMVEKGSQTSCTPWANESVQRWSSRVSDLRLKGVRWALDSICVPKYQLAEKYNLNMSEAHDAGFDCQVTGYLFEEYKSIYKG